MATLFSLFEVSTFDAYDSGADRYGAVLTAGLDPHELDLSDMWAVTQDLRLWAIWGSGLFNADLKGIFRRVGTSSTAIPRAEAATLAVKRRLA